MKTPGGNRRRPRRPDPKESPEVALHRFAVGLFDKGDGRAVDWPAVAAALFKVGFACLDEAEGDERAAKVVRRVHDGAYNRMAGSPDSGTPYTATQPERPPFVSDPGMTPGFDHTP